MRDLLLGCVSVIIGMFLGALLTVAAVMLLTGNRGSAGAITDPLLLPSRADIEISASAKYVTTQLQQMVRQGGLASQATVALVSPNQMRITAPVTIPLFGQPIQVNATVTMSLAVRNGRVALTVDNVDANGTSVPRSIWPPFVEAARAQAEDQLNRIVQQTLQGTGLRLTGIRITPDALTLDLSGA